MNEVNNRINFYNSYFHGLQDILEFKSAKQTALGLVKILSGFTLIVPIIFGIGYLVSKHQLKKLESLCNKVSKALNSDTYATQKELIKFLSIKVLNHDQNQFEKAFNRLDYSFQEKFFAKMADKGVLVDALTLVPQDLKEINIDFGYLPSSEMIDKTIEQLSKFKKLHTINFNISKTTYLTKGIDHLFELSMKIIASAAYFKEVRADFDPKFDYAKNGAESRENNYMPAYRIIRGLSSILPKESQLARIHFKFKTGFGDRFTTATISNDARILKKLLEYGSAETKRHVLAEEDLGPPSHNWVANTGWNTYLAKEKSSA